MHEYHVANTTVCLKYIYISHFYVECVWLCGVFKKLITNIFTVNVVCSYTISVLNFVV